MKVRGGDFAAVQDPSDGTWTIKDVPVFTTHEREVVVPGDRGPEKRRVTVDRDWLDKAVSRGQSRYAKDRHLAPTTIRHNGGLFPAEPAGVFLPTRVAEMEYEGERRPWIFGDIGKIPQRVYEQVRAFQLLFRSPETTVKGDPEILALSLLPTETPYFRGPMTTVGTEMPADRRVTLQTRRGQPILAYSADDDRATFLVRPPMPEAVPTTAAASEKPATFDVNAGDKILSALQALVSEIQGLKAALGVKGAGEESAPPEPDGEETSQYRAALAAMDGRVAGLESQIKAAKAEKDAAALVAKYAADLSAAGFSIAPAVLAEKHAAYGEKGLAAYADAVMANGVAAPPADLEAALGAAAANGGTVPGINEDVSFFATYGADVVREATALSATYDAMPLVGRGSLDRRTFIGRTLQGANRIPRNAALVAASK